MGNADLVLEGGGVKGIGLVGAISVLEEHGYTFHRVAGTSAGAIVGSLVAAGMPVTDLVALMRAIDYHEFEDGDLLDKFGIPGKGLSILFEEGIYEGKYLTRWLGAELEKVGVRTFADLALDDPGASAGPARSSKLVVMTSDISEGRLVRLPWNYDHYDLDPLQQRVVDAVRMSMSIPFFYEPVKLKKRWFVDGGMLSNFPVDTFDRTDGKPPRWPTFGIKLSARPTANQVPHQIDGVIGFAKAMLGTMTNFHDQIHLDDPSVVARTIFVDCGTVHATDFDIDAGTQNLLFESGRAAATRFLAAWDFDAYVAKHRSAPPG